MAVTGHGNGLYLVDEEGHPVRNGIISTDSRAKEYVEEMATLARIPLPTFCQNTMQSIWAGQPVALLAWLKDFEPETLQKSALYFLWSRT
ncbi:hypothetical protein LN650_26160 [Klebsiella pneumoniae subsp. pneumoniae]|nr:hypothetical protein [Klebsiella pneumoniae subsp. pneumoniae]